MTDGKITSEWLVLNDESVPQSGIPMRISIHPKDVPTLVEKLSKWDLDYTSKNNQQPL